MARKQRIKRERGEKWEPKIRFREDRERWMVDLGTKFTPRKLYFADKDEAVAAAARKKEEFLTLLSGRKQADKEKAPFNWFNLSTEQREHLASAFTSVGGNTARILRAIAFHSKHTSSADSSRQISDVYDEYIRNKTASGKRQRTISDTQFKLKTFLETFGKISISSITTADVESWLNQQGYVSTTRNAYRTAISGLFNHAVKRRYVEYNPVTAIETVTVDQGLPSIHTIAQVKAMLKTASTFTPSRMVVAARDSNRKVTKRKPQVITDPEQIQKARAAIVPYLAIGYFAGLRPENELVNLDWKDIDLEARTIRVDPATSKKRRQRYVDMSENLVKWLTPYARKEGKIGFSRAIFRTVRDTAKVEWSKDVMRHSFGSYLLAHNEDAPKTAMQMGHSGVDVLFNHYRNLVKKTEAAEYWNIAPEHDAPSTAKG